MQGLGATPSDIAEMRKDTEAHALVLQPECVEPFHVFRRLGTQWRSQMINTMQSARLVRTGLDYSAAAQVATVLGFEFDATMLDHLQIMEAEALKVFADEARS